MSTASEYSTYEEAVAAHEWQVPERYNIAAGRVRQAPGRQARDDPRGRRGQRPRGATGASCRSSPTASPTCCAAHGVEQGDRVAMLLPPTPETAAAFFGTYKSGAILLSMSVLYGDDGIRHRVKDSQAKVLVTNAANQHRVDPALVDAGAAARRRAAAERRAGVRRRRHRRRRPRAALLLVGHDRPRQGHRARAPLPARARGVRLLPRRAGRRALPRHGRVGVGGRHRAAARAVALRRRPARAPAQGRLRPAQAARLPVAPRGDERLHDADRDALDDVDRERGREVPAEVPHRLLGRRAAEPRGDPLVPRAVRR